MTKSFFNKQHTINCRGKLLDLSTPKVMGIINTTPDSFYDKSRFLGNEEVERRTIQIIEEGGDIIDIGAYSSRPGAEHIDENIEWERLAPVLDVVRKVSPHVIISVDTFRSGIAKRAVNEYGIDIINDISAGSMDDDMFATVAQLNVPYIIMHMQGTPQDMQDNTLYEHLMKDVFMFFATKVKKLNSLGVSDIIIDPGFGFGKTVNQNYELLAKLDEFKVFELPILTGVSRKSMIYKFLETTPEKALNGTSVLNTMALYGGSNILRVHDVKEAVEAKLLFGKLQQSIV